MNRLEREPLAFAVLLGDYMHMHRPSPEEHRLFISELSEDISAPFPVFLIVGNHDVDKDTFPAAEFEKLYGPTNFWFSHRGCLFIVLRVIDNPLGPDYTTEQSLRFLESVLAEQRARHDKVFVLQHYPPPVSDDFRARDYPEAGEELRLCDRYRVDYLITGDFHGYARVKRRHTVYLVTGGGGGTLTGRTFGRFHHALVFHVGPEGVSERILVPTGLGTGLGTQLEHLAAVRLPRWLREVPALFVACNVVLVALTALLGWGLVRSLRAGRPRREAPAHGSGEGMQ